MPSFALIAEGQTDLIILERIIEQICSDKFEDDVDVNHLQPLRDATDKARSMHAPHAGWELVLECCRIKAEEALAANDFVVVQIDTDCGDHPRYGLPLTEHGNERPYQDLLFDARKIIANAIGDHIFEPNADRFIFAISVHSIESWMLLYLFNIDRTKNCFNHLDRELQRKNYKPLTKEVRVYQPLAMEIRRRRLNDLIETENSLGQFLRSLTSLRTPPCLPAPPEREAAG